MNEMNFRRCRGGVDFCTCDCTRCNRFYRFRDGSRVPHDCGKKRCNATKRRLPQAESGGEK